MNLEILAAIAALLEQGVIVEPIGYAGAVRIRLADDDDSNDSGVNGETVRSW